MRTLLAFAFAMLPLVAVADTSACYTITDPDARAYCRARIQKDPSTCYAIQDSAKRAVCLAEVRR